MRLSRTLSRRCHPSLQQFSGDLLVAHAHNTTITTALVRAPPALTARFPLTIHFFILNTLRHLTMERDDEKRHEFLLALKKKKQKKNSRL